MTKIKLSRRMEAIARLVPLSGGVADVGTDHGYIPISLLQRGFADKIVATDINPGPLESAKCAAAGQGVSDKISFYLCDGLAALDGDGLSTVIIAGMGGETIASILEAAPWTKESGRLLILQPMSKSERLRSWLFENVYRVLTEELVEDGAVYELMTVTGGEDTPYEAGELLTGHYSLISGDPLFPARLDALTEKCKRAAEGLSASSDPECKNRLRKINESIEGLSALKARLR